MPCQRFRLLSWDLHFCRLEAKGSSFLQARVWPPVILTNTDLDVFVDHKTEHFKTIKNALNYKSHVNI